MPSSSTLAPDQRFMALFVGDSGSGKTPAACSWFHEGKVKNLDFDGRIRGLLGCPWIDRSKIDYDYYPAVKPGLATMFSRLNNDLEVLEIQAKSGQNPYKTFIPDSLSSMTWLLLKDAISISHVGNGNGLSMGPLKLAQPGDIRFEINACKDIITFFRSLPGINFICTAHLVDKYGPVDADDPYKGSKIVGQKLSLRDTLSAEIPGGFDHVFEFKREMIGNGCQFFVRFWSDIARTTFQGMPQGWQNITGKDFYLFMHECVKKGQAALEIKK